MRIDPTPNPNSIKITLERKAIASGTFSASSAAQAEANSVAKDLFALGEVTNVFLLNNFISVNKAPDVSWDELTPRIEEVIRKHYGD